MDEEERHWNQICLGIITIATAVFAAAFFASEIANIDISSDVPTYPSEKPLIRNLQLAKFVIIAIALTVYLRLVVIGGKTIFATPADLSRDGTSKRAGTRYVFLGFCVILLELFILLLIDLLTATVIIPD